MGIFSQSWNTATGSGALGSITTGSGNTATGFEALTYNTTSSYNSAHGFSVLGYYVSGDFNTATGNNSLENNTSGQENTGDGSHSLSGNQTGSWNTTVGFTSLSVNKSGNYNTCIGRYANTENFGYNNSTAIGELALFTNNNQVRIGTGSTTSIGGYVGWSNLSDGRTKKNIQQDVPGLAFINKLQPVTYNFDLDAVDYLQRGDKAKDMLAALSQEEKAAREDKEKRLYTGFVAQDVEKTAQSIDYNFSGIEVDESGVYSLEYSEFVMPLVKAVQEYNEKNNALQVQVNELTKLVEKLLKKRAK